MTQTRYCVRHPKTETNIRCGKCDETICAECLVHAPVGMRCPDCARVNRVPTYDVTLPYLLRGIGAGVATALGLGAAFSFGVSFIFGLVFPGNPLINTIIQALYVPIPAAIGFVVGEAVSLATNRKRGTVLKFVSAGSVLLASALITLSFLALPAAFNTMYLFIGLAVATWLSIRRF